MYYQAQVRNLAHEAELQREMADIHLQESRFNVQKLSKSNRKKTMTPSRRQEDQQAMINFKKSRNLSELDASKVSTNAILNRSRIQAALQNRQRNNQLAIETKRLILQEEQNIVAELQAERELILENQRQRQLALIRQENQNQQIYKNILLRQELRIEDEIRKREIEKRIYEQKIKRQLDLKYNTLKRPYYYY